MAVLVVLVHLRQVELVRLGETEGELCVRQCPQVVVQSRPLLVDLRVRFQVVQSRPLLESEGRPGSSSDLRAMANGRVHLRCAVREASVSLRRARTGVRDQAVPAIFLLVKLELTGLAEERCSIPANQQVKGHGLARRQIEIEDLPRGPIPDFPIVKAEVSGLEGQLEQVHRLDRLVRRAKVVGVMLPGEQAMFHRLQHHQEGFRAEVARLRSSPRSVAGAMSRNWSQRS